MKQAVIREGADDFEAFKICTAAVKSGGDVVSITVSPVCVFDHIQGYAKPEAGGRLRWIVWMTFDEAFDVEVLDAAVTAEG